MVFRVYNESYTRIAEREVASGSLGGLPPVGGNTSWLLYWFGIAETDGPDAQPIVGPITESDTYSLDSFVDTPCGFVGVGDTSSSIAGPYTYGVDFGAPSGVFTAFDTVSQPYRPDVEVSRWPYDGESIAVLRMKGDFETPPPPARLLVVSPSGASSYDVVGGAPIATPIGLVVISVQPFGASVSASVIGSDGTQSALLPVAPVAGAEGVSTVKAVWSSGELVVLWDQYDKGDAIYGATLRCAD